MKTTLLVLESLLLSGILNTGLFSQNYVTYHHRTFNVEKLIAAENYSEALAVYDSIFTEYFHAFYKDLHNACICACETGQLKKAAKYAEKLVTQGYEITDFNNSGFAPLRDDKKLWQKIEKKYTLLRKQYDNSLNHKLRKKYSDLLLSDQVAAKSRNSLHSQDSVFYHQAIEISELFQKNGFPALDTNKDTLRIKVFAMLRHYFGLVNRFQRGEEMQRDSFYTAMNFTTTKLDSIVLAALHTGKILPQTYADAMSYSAGNPYGNLAIKIDFETETVGFHLNMKPEQVEEINKRRDKIGLFPIKILSNDILKSSWYNDYPFKEIKEAFLKCNACEMEDYVTLKKMEEDKVRNRFILEKDKDLILFDFNQIKETWNTGLDKYMKTN